MPISYDFNIPKDSLYKTIINVFSSFTKIKDSFSRYEAEKINFTQYYYLDPEYYGVENARYFDPDNYIHLPISFIRDEYLDSLQIWHPIGLSYNYKFGGTEIRPVYDACFFVNLESTSANSTRATVVTLKPRIAVGRKREFDAHKGMVWNPVWQDSEPSTIEEYQILLRIGERLGIKKNMPQLIIPKLD